jgi:trimethylamine:corrinoid methyltransferase-like protein
LFLKIPTPKKRSRSITRLYQRRKGPHQPLVLEKETKAPNQFTEATLLRAMETAGKQVDDEDLRELMKENGIDVRQHERILLKRYLNVNTSLEIKNRCYQRRLGFS